MSITAPHHSAYGTLDAPNRAGVRVAPSNQTLRRADPSLSFQVSAPGAVAFDVVLATDPSLFLAGSAHRRTGRNFRCSRQDYGNQPIEAETGFYLVPRAFIRDLVLAQPRPDRLYYLAVAYGEENAVDGDYSVDPARVVEEAPWVTLAGDLVAESLGKVLGMAVETLGTLGRAGRVMRLASAMEAELPRMIGGLPVGAREPSAGSSDTAGPRTPQAGARTPTVEPVPQAPRQQDAPGSGAPASPPLVPPVADESGRFGDQPFSDEDLIGQPWSDSDADAGAGDFRDLDRQSAPDASFDYDDGFDDKQYRDNASVALSRPPADGTQPHGTPDAPADGGSLPDLDPGPDHSMPAAATDWEDDLVALVVEEGMGNRYGVLNLDGAFRGRFGAEHPFYQRAHEGLRYGPHQVSQESGELGSLVEVMHDADPEAFVRHFGPQSKALLAVLNADGPGALESPDGRSVRVQPVDGADLWEDPWVDRFRSAASHPPFQAAMRRHIAATRLAPMLAVARALGLAEARGLGMLLAIAMHEGVPEAVDRVRRLVDPFDTEQRLAAVLSALGHSGLAAFRASMGLPAGDTLDTQTHLALLEALRGLGSEAPVPVPDPEDVKDRLVTSVGPGALGDVLLRLRVSERFDESGATERQP